MKLEVLVFDLQRENAEFIMRRSLPKLAAWQWRKVFDRDAQRFWLSVRRPGEESIFPAEDVQGLIRCLRSLRQAAADSEEVFSEFEVVHLCMPDAADAVRQVIAEPEPDKRVGSRIGPTVLPRPGRAVDRGGPLGAA